MRRTLALCLLVFGAIATNAFAVGEARITGKIIDAVTKAPILDAVISVSAVEGKTFKQQYTVDKKDGTYAIFLLDGTIRYKFTFSATGYTTYEETMKLKLGEPNIRNFELSKGGALGGPTGAGSEVKADPAVAAYNEAATLANAGKDAEAIAKLQEALAAKPDMVPALEALAKISLRAKSYAKAIEAANKVLAIDTDNQDMFAVLYDSYNATGDKAKAAEYKKKLPANAPGLFNDAAKLINAGKDAEAEPLLRQAIAADEKFAPAYYELGMLCVRLSKNADAKANLEKYIELDPKGKDAATAKEMLNYVK
ncbi:MAG TPA: carboxypeptidase regulatory-like domain-containing protein [Thermoanaerobaculia bacterium]|nr:carboxypeptidase regulatory-like domain-containing protein [Thermoanaerobaculia bacterium]